MTTTTQIPAAVDAIYNRTLLERALPALVHARWGQKSTIPLNEGDTVKWRKFASLGLKTTPITEGIDPQADQISVTDRTLQIKQYAGVVKTLQNRVEQWRKATRDPAR